MSTTVQEQLVNDAFSKQSPVFDEIDENNSLLIWMRHRIRQEVLRYAQPGNKMLELNCGTGLDARFFARKGLHITATDNAPGMLEQLNKKVVTAGLQGRIETAQCSFNHLEDLGSTPRFDYVFSNFGGLNCTNDLAGVLDGIDKLLKPGGYFSLVIMPKICIWELLLVFKGHFKTAFRRLKPGGTKAHLEGVNFDCYYYQPEYIIRHMKASYSLKSLKGLAIAVPPPYIENFREKHPILFERLERWENRLWDKLPFRGWGDHFIITMQKK